MSYGKNPWTVITKKKDWSVSVNGKMSFRILECEISKISVGEAWIENPSEVCIEV